jgi:DNA-binding Lrp family transcriptional regulator
LPHDSIPVDKVDRIILKELRRDCRMSCREIAKSARVSTGTVLKRIERLERSGVIIGYSARVDPEKVGYELTMMAEITVSNGRLIEMEQMISKLPNTCAVYDVTGVTDAIVIAKFRDREELSKFTKSLLSMPFINRTNTRLVLKTIKEDFRIPDRSEVHG